MSSQLKSQVIIFLVYKGKNLKFSAEEIAIILHKRFSYFDKLSTSEKIVFYSGLINLCIKRFLEFMMKADLKKCRS